jgi:cytochrome P450
MLHHIYSDPHLLETIRSEITPHITILEPSRSTGLPIPEPRRLSRLDREGLTTSCPVLKSVYIECLRLDTASWSLKVVKNDVVLRARNDGGGGGGGEETTSDGSDGKSAGWTLRKGEYVHAAHDLHNTDPKYFPDPMTWKAERHVKIDAATGRATGADLGSIRPYGMLSFFSFFFSPFGFH